MNTLEYIKNKYQISGKPPFHLPIGRSDLPDLFKELGFKVGAEIGTERGVFAKKLSEFGGKLFCIDPWLAYKGYREHVSQEKLDGFYEETKERLKGGDVVLFRETSDKASTAFEDNSLDFVYIDGNHEFYYIVKDIYNWTPKVRKGGIIAGHDFRRNSGKYVNDTKDVIPGYAYSKKLDWFILDDKTTAPSWMWIKP